MFAVLDKKSILKHQPNNPLYHGNAIVGHNDEFHENESESLTQEQWLVENIPFIQTPDKALDEVYYFRWANLLNALSKRRADGQYEFCEAGVGSYYHKYIDCAQGAHIREARWIKDGKYLNSYLHITPEHAVYREYITDSVWQKYLLDGDASCIRENYEKLKARLGSLEQEYDAAVGLYHCLNDREGQECGVNGFELAQSHIRIDLHTDGAEVTAELPAIRFTGMRIWSRKQGSAVFTAADKEIPCNAQILAYPKGAVEYRFEEPVSGTVKITGCETVEKVVPIFELHPHGKEQWWILVGGSRSYRVGYNAFQIAANLALSKMAALLGLEQETEAFSAAANALWEAYFAHLWNEEASFFLEKTVDGKVIHGKECGAYAPWAFSLVPDDPEFARAFSYMLRDDSFLSPYGLTSLERSNPHYMQSFNHRCLWNGPVWPYTFSLALTALATHLQHSQHTCVDKEQYYDLLSRYAACHRESGEDSTLAVKENHHPEEPRWIAENGNYNHSTYIDNILAGLFGICPTESGLDILPLVPDGWKYFCVDNLTIRGKSYSVLYDESGEMYHKGKGYYFFCQEKLVYRNTRPCKVHIPWEE